MLGANKGRDGFTVVELAIVLTVIAALAMIALPAFRNAQLRVSVRFAADEFAARHSMARTLAIRYGGVSRYNIDVTNGRLWVEVDTTALRTGTRDTVGTVAHLTNDLRVTLTSNRSLLCFDARGMATQAGGCPPGDAQVVFMNAGYADTVTTSTIGKLLR